MVRYPNLNLLPWVTNVLFSDILCLMYSSILYVMFKSKIVASFLFSLNVDINDKLRFKSKCPKMMMNDFKDFEL